MFNEYRIFQNRIILHSPNETHFKNKRSRVYIKYLLKVMNYKPQNFRISFPIIQKSKMRKQTDR